MTNLKQKLVDVLIVVLVPVSLFALYKVFLYEPPIPTIQSASGGSQVSDLEMKIHALEQLKFDDGLFQMQSFTEFQDRTVQIEEIPLRPKGSNPFSEDPTAVRAAATAPATTPTSVKPTQTKPTTVELGAKLDQLKQQMGR